MPRGVTGREDRRGTVDHLAIIDSLGHLDSAREQARRDRVRDDGYRPARRKRRRTTDVIAMVMGE
jgi:hypothetical protein